MKRDEKEAVITSIATDMNEAEAIFVVDYRGMTVAQIASLRAQLREADTTLRVTKNTLTMRAADATEAPGAEELKSVLVGPTAIAFVRGDVALAAKGRYIHSVTLASTQGPGVKVDTAQIKGDAMSAAASAAPVAAAPAESAPVAEEPSEDQAS